MTALSTKGHFLCWSKQDCLIPRMHPTGLQAKRAVESVPTFSDLPDLLLVERTRGRDTRAFETLMRRYNRRLYRIARSILSNDDTAEEAVRGRRISARSRTSIATSRPANSARGWRAWHSMKR